MTELSNKNEQLAALRHEHVFEASNRAAERGTRLVVWITLVMMVVEISAGYWFNSMALLADGWHMSSHALAIGLSAIAYASSRKYARDARFAFGTWKIEILAGYTSAIFLLGIAGLMVFGSIERILSPQSIHYEEATIIAVIGLVVNLVCAVILGGAHDHDHGGHGHGHAHGGGHGHGHGHGHKRGDSHGHGHASGDRHGQDHGHAHDHGHDHDHGHAHAHEHGHAHVHAHGKQDAHGHDDPRAPGHSQPQAPAHRHGDGHGHAGHPPGHGARQAQGGDRQQDLNLKSAYIHVITDAATSVLAIVALIGGWIYGWSWLDPAMGIVGAVLVALWAKNLIIETGKILLDREMDHPVVQEIRAAVEGEVAAGDTTVVDLHVWRVGKQSYSCALSVVTHDRTLTAATLRERIRGHEEVVHTTIEIQYYA